MRRFTILMAFAMASFALLSSAAQAQYIVQSAPSVVYYQPAAPVYYQPAYVAPTVRYSYYAPAPVVTYSAPVTTYAPVVSYSAPVVTYAAPVVTYAAPAGVVTTRSYYGYGIFRPRGYYTESYYTPIR
jgi:hypothetical protein